MLGGLVCAVCGRDYKGVDFLLEDFEIVQGVAGGGEGLDAGPVGNLERRANPLVVAPGIEDGLGDAAAVIWQVGGEELISGFVLASVSC